MEETVKKKENRDTLAQYYDEKNDETLKSYLHLKKGEGGMIV